MDGHDNDANKNAQNNSNGRQGIFSTPELTVNKENITQPNDIEAKSRVASIFANTDAGKQAQKLNSAMDAQVEPVAEDLVVQNSPRKKSKLPIILLIVVLAVAVIGGVVWTIVNNMSNKTPHQTPSAAFASYSELLEKGPELPTSDEENADYQGEEWSIFKLSQSGLQTSEQQKYAAELAERYRTFLESINNTEVEVPDSLKKQAASYEKLLSLVIQYNTIGLLENEIIGKYIKDSAESSYQYASTIVDTDFSDDYSLQKIAELLNNYFVDEYKVVEFYDYSGCISQNEVNYFCAAELESTNASYSEVANRQQNTRKMLNAYAMVLAATFDDDTDKLANTVKETL